MPLPRGPARVEKLSQTAGVGGRGCLGWADSIGVRPQPPPHTIGVELSPRHKLSRRGG